MTDMELLQNSYRSIQLLTTSNNVYGTINGHGTVQRNKTSGTVPCCIHRTMHTHWTTQPYNARRATQQSQKFKTITEPHNDHSTAQRSCTESHNGHVTTQKGPWNLTTVKEYTMITQQSRSCPPSPPPPSNMVWDFQKFPRRRHRSRMIITVEGSEKVPRGRQGEGDNAEMQAQLKLTRGEQCLSR
jgi:hypothetical protein